MTLAVPRAVARPIGPARHARPARYRGPIAVLAALVLLHVLVLAGAPAPLRAAVGLPLVMLLPGALLLRALGVRRHFFHMVVASLAVLLVTATLLALAGWLSPVDCLIGLDLTLAVLAVAAAVRGRRRARTGEDGRVPEVRDRAPAVLAAVLPPAVAGGAGVVLAVLGAARLNAGGGPAVALAGLAAVLVTIAIAAHAAHRGRPGTAAAGLYLAGLAVLLATSLRGTGVTGHDIKIEYHVLMDVLETGRWRPGGTYAGYNSCLSLTTLPAFLARLLGLAPLDVFRVGYQLIFAIAPVGAFLLARRLLTPAAAVLAAGLFIAFPTFVNDMPMLNRQELALLFFLMLLLALTDTRGPRGPRVALLVIAAAGLTVSHYSSTAVAAALLALAALLRVIRRRLPGLADGMRRPPALAWPAALLAVMLLGWALCTGSATAFASGAAETGQAISEGAAVLSDSTRYLRPGEDAPDDQAALISYVDGLRAERELSGAGACPTVPLPADELAPTALGAAIGVPRTANTLLRQAILLLFLAGAAAGCGLLWWRAHRAGRPTVRVLAEIGTAALVLLGVAVIAPQITDSYGLLRLYQQMLPVLGPAVLIALARVPRRALIALVIVVLASTSGLVPRLTGGYPPQLNLASAGPYYHAWYATDADARDAAAVERALPPGAAPLADSRVSALLRTYTELEPVEGVAPGALWPDSHLVLRADGITTAVIGERVVRYPAPPGCLTAGRALLLTAGHLQLWGPR